MHDCPRCAKPVDGQVCPYCGHQEETRKAKAPARDPDWWRCSFVKDGKRCENAGGISNTTTGGGPWYCRDHYRYVAAVAHRQGPPGGWERVKAALRSREPGEEG